MGYVVLHKFLHSPDLPWSTVEGDLVARAKLCLEACLCSQTSQLPEVHDTYSGTEMVGLLHCMSSQNLHEGTSTYTTCTCIHIKCKIVAKLVQFIIIQTTQIILELNILLVKVDTHNNNNNDTCN